MSRRGWAGLGSGLLDRRSRGGVRLVAALVWLLFIVFPLANAVGRNGPALQHGLVIGGAAAFVAAYIAVVLTWRRHERERLSVALFSVLLALAVALTLADRPGWGFLFTYSAACAGMITRSNLGFFLVALCTATAAGASLIAGGSGSTAIGFAASSAGIGLLMLLMRDLRMRNEELTEARAELARLAVAQERERFARDLHDLLGHSLSVIALKAELAGRLLPGRPAEAASEVAEVEEVARSALGEVREAVSGYRQPTLEEEFAGARMALAAAGIEAFVEHRSVALDPSTEAVLAWAVREGATNVIRHSRARHCVIRVTASLGGTALEVIDDGVGRRNGGGPGRGGGGSARGHGGPVRGARGPAREDGVPARGGHGLEGLAERAEAIDGRLEAGARPEGGFRLAITVPLTPP